MRYKLFILGIVIGTAYQTCFAQSGKPGDLYGQPRKKLMKVQDRNTPAVSAQVTDSSHSRSPEKRWLKAIDPMPSPFTKEVWDKLTEEERRNLLVGRKQRESDATEPKEDTVDVKRKRAEETKVAAAKLEKLQLECSKYGISIEGLPNTHDESDELEKLVALTYKIEWLEKNPKAKKEIVEGVKQSHPVKGMDIAAAKAAIGKPARSSIDSEGTTVWLMPNQLTWWSADGKPIGGLGLRFEHDVLTYWKAE